MSLPARRIGPFTVSAVSLGGMNLFVIQSMAPYINIRETYRGVWPFVASDLIRVTLLVVFPAITLFVLRLG